METNAESKHTDDGYFMASKDEISRLENNHYIIKAAMGGNLLLPPINITTSPLRILDSATADGTWIRDVAASSDIAHRFIGTDIDPSKFPQDPPASTKYLVQDINKPWPEEWKQSFDIVHQRLSLAASGPGAKQAIQNLALNVNPGGWIQLIEAENFLNISEKGSAMYNFVQLILDLYAFMGAPTQLSNQLKPWLEESGFTNVQERTIDCLMGSLNPDRQLAKNGVYSMNVAVTGLVGFGKTLRPDTLFKGQDSQKILSTLVDDLKAEMIATGANYPLKVVWGQFPA